MQEPRELPTGGAARGWLGDWLADRLIDAILAASALWLRLRLWLAVATTVWFDCGGASRLPIPVRGRCPCDAFTVECAESETVLRGLAWFYREFDSPDADDWKACLDRFGWARVPSHLLDLRFAGQSVGVKVEINDLDPFQGNYIIRLNSDAEFLSGRVPIGGYRPSAMIARLFRCRDAKLGVAPAGRAPARSRPESPKLRGSS